jgi:hypothetical protein
LAGGVKQEFGNDASDGSFQFEQAALVEDCGHGGGGDDFGEGGEIEQRGGFDFMANVRMPNVKTADVRIPDVKIPTLSRRARQGWGTLGIGEMAEGFERDETIVVRDGCGSGGEGAGRDCVPQNREGRGKDFVLMVESGNESWEVVQGLDARCGISDLSGL